MKSRPVIILLVATFLTSGAPQFSVDEIDSDNDLLLATSEVIVKGFGASAVTINFIFALSDETRVQHNRLIDNLIASCTNRASAIRVELATRREQQQQQPLTSVFVEDVNFITQRQKLYNVIFIDTINSFHQLNSRLNERRSSNFVIDGYYLMIFVVERSIGELSEVTMRLWSHSIYNVLIVLPDNGRQRSLEGILNSTRESRLSLITFKPFASPLKCDDTTPVTVNVFTRGRFTTDQFFMSKMNNLSHCPIKVVSFNCPPMMMISYDVNSGRPSLDGIDGRMLNTLSEVLAFSVELVHIDDDVG